MKWIYEITFFICVVGILDALLCIVIPNGSLEKSVRLVASLVLSVFIAAKIAGLGEGGFAFGEMGGMGEITEKIDIDSYSGYSDEVLDSFIQTMGKRIENVLDEKCDDSGKSRVVVIANIDENYIINIVRINVYTPLKVNEAKKIVSEYAGVEQDKVFVISG